MKGIQKSPDRQPDAPARFEPIDERDYVSPRIAALLTGETPYAIRRRFLQGPAALRSIHSRGRLLLHLGDARRGPR